MWQFREVICNNQNIYTCLIHLPSSPNIDTDQLHRFRGTNARGARWCGSGVLPTPQHNTTSHMIGDATFHPYPKEPLPGKRQHVSLPLMTRWFMKASEHFGLQRVGNNKLVNFSIHFPFFIIYFFIIYKRVVANLPILINWLIFDIFPVDPANNREIISQIHYGWLMFSYASSSLFYLIWPLYFFV